LWDLQACMKSEGMAVTINVAVKNWMTGDPVSIGAEATALDALDLMVDHDIRHLPVLDSERHVVGVLSIDDLRAVLPVPVRSPRDPSPPDREHIKEWRVGEIMSHAPEVLRENASLGDAADRMADRRIGCVPIVDESDRLVGLLSETDALRALAASIWSEEVAGRRGSARDLEGLVRELKHERERIAKRLDRFHEAERQLSADQHDRPMDDSERGADLREVRFVERLDALAAQRLEAIDRALDHAAQGRLSVCDVCGGSIPLARLRALPGTTICVSCARAREAPIESEEPFERVPGGRAESGRPELGGSVYTRFGEGQLLRVAPFGTCRRCGDVEGFHDVDRDAVVCSSDGCRHELTGVRDRAIVAVGEREVYVDPVELSSPAASPYD
jgi:CBS domain-containing protein/RNA polymerase-binding transcription factor DksA